MSEDTLQVLLELFQMVSFRMADEGEDLYGEASLANHQRLQKAYKEVRVLLGAIRGGDL